MAFIRIQDYESFLEKDLTFFTLTQDTRVVKNHHIRCLLVYFLKIFKLDD